MGNRQARELLFTSLYPHVLRQARALCRQDGDVEDLAQTALLLVLRRLGQLRECCKLLGWMWRVVQNAHRMTLRRRENDRVVRQELGKEQRPSASPRTLGPQDRLLAQEQRQELLNRVNNLTPVLRETFELRVFSAQSTAQTASSLGISEEAVRTRLTRARRALKAPSSQSSAHPTSSRALRSEVESLLRRQGGAYGLDLLAVHDLSGRLGSIPVPPGSSYLICQLLPARPTLTPEPDLDEDFPIRLCRIDLVRSESCYRLQAGVDAALVHQSESNWPVELSSLLESALQALRRHLTPLRPRKPR